MRTPPDSRINLHRSGGEQLQLMLPGISMVTNSNKILTIISFMVCLSVTVQAQMINGKPSTGSTGFVYTYWQLETANASNTSLGQYWMPLSGFVALQENLEARYYLAGSTNSYQAGNSEVHLEGLGDTRIEITRSFSGNQFFV